MKLRRIIAIGACVAAVGLSACGEKCPTETPRVDAVASCTGQRAAVSVLLISVMLALLVGVVIVGSYILSH